MVRAGKLAFATGVVAAALTVTAGPASAGSEEPVEDPPAVHVLPGLDLGPVLGPTAEVPAIALAPVHGLLTAIGG